MSGPALRYTPSRLSRPGKALGTSCLVPKHNSGTRSDNRSGFSHAQPKHTPLEYLIRQVRLSRSQSVSRQLASSRFLASLTGPSCIYSARIGPGRRCRWRDVYSNRPVCLATALVALLGFVPMSIDTVNGGRGSKSACHQVIGEPITSTVLTLFLLPAVWVVLRGQEAERGSHSAEDESTARGAGRLRGAEVSPMRIGSKTSSNRPGPAPRRET
jgi:hypothetical protein